MKGINTIAAHDPASNKALKAWPCGPDKGVHRIAVARESNGWLVVCADKRVLLARSNGKVTATESGARVDEMTCDPSLNVAQDAGH